jgi:hypothetical protein
MTKFYTSHGGSKHVKGHSYDKVVGSRAAVWHGTAHHTKGGLTKAQLMLNKRGRIVSRKKHATAKRDRRLEKAGYKTRKGHFGFVKASTKGGRRRRGHRSRRHRGGNGINYALTPSHFDGKGVGTSGVDLQFVAGNAA